MSEALLCIDRAHVQFGGVVAVADAGFAVAPGERVGLIGPNGAGKTTLLRVISGVVSPTRGRVTFRGEDITRLPVHRRARRGLGLSQQIVRPFRSMSVLDNVALAAGAARTRRPLGALLARDRTRERERARELLALVGIGRHADSAPATLPLGVLKRLEVARALALDPQLLLLDEPLAGLNHVEAHRLADIIVAVNEQGPAVILIEHNLGEVARVCGRLLVLDQGTLIADAEPAVALADERVRAAYMGRDDAAA